mgnify:CR=1 FL=1
MDECIFCKIISGEVPTPKIYEDDEVVAFLDIRPINKGHTLVIPKKHVPDFQKLDDELYISVMKVVKRIASVVEEKLAPKRIGLVIAGWDVPHTHVHVVPMHDYHDITSKRMLESNPVTISEEELQEVTELLKIS